MEMSVQVYSEKSEPSPCALQTVANISTRLSQVIIVKEIRDMLVVTH